MRKTTTLALAASTTLLLAGCATAPDTGPMGFLVTSRVHGMSALTWPADLQLPLLTRSQRPFRDIRCRELVAPKRSVAHASRPPMVAP